MGATSAAPLGVPRLHLRSVGSTNARAQELAAAGAPHGTLVTAREQTAGRGRQGRAWSTPPGSALAASLVLRGTAPLLPLLAAVAVAEVAAARDAERREVAIKWPNDVLVGERKVAGILTEGRPQEGWAVLGIGLNVAVAADAFPPALRERATSLGGRPEDLEPVLEELLNALARWLAAPTAELLSAYRARDALAGRPVEWAGGSGTAAGIADDGRLRVRDADGGETLLGAGEVHLGALPPR
ncbi:MAG: biotin/acetyl-CoA-carboxylase ligase [Conexibacter sp.]|jgi:BirA family biotin operon repressor/biotin-[acetyl-CoA-carboxylase] ligase|nr:biotin/acetyl-CoA-carboxylase ligase [Conexibacter sp.]